MVSFARGDRLYWIVLPSDMFWWIEYLFFSPFQEEARKKSKLTEKKDYWLRKGIIVKITTKRLGEKYLKKKGVVKVILSPYIVSISVLVLIVRKKMA